MTQSEKALAQAHRDCAKHTKASHASCLESREHVRQSKDAIRQSLKLLKATTP